MKTLIALVLLVLVIATLSTAVKFMTAKCPEAKYGRGERKITYFSSPWCISCWFQKDIIGELEKEKGNAFTIEEYNVDLCRNIPAVKGVPAFLIGEKLIYGLQSKENLLEIIG